MKIFFVDTETTGLGKDDKICEVAYIHVDDDLNVISHSTSLINPGRPISAGAGAINGITDAMVADAQTIEAYMAGEGSAMVDHDVLIIGHSIAFDMKYLGQHLPESVKTLCTLKCARYIYPDAENHKQATLAYMLGITTDRSKAHSADGDIDVLIGIFACMMRDANVDLAGMLAIQDIPVKITKMNFGMHRGVKLEDLPASYVRWCLEDYKALKPDMRQALLDMKAAKHAH